MQKLNEKKILGTVPKKLQLVETFWDCPEFSRNKQNQNGITLIALIITIIVMLILVGVTINVALNGGLFEKAETATKGTEEKAILEEMLAMMYITDDGKIDYQKIEQEMSKKYSGEGYSYSYPNLIIKGKLGTYTYILSETEIKIGETNVPSIDEDFERYIMGATKKGRPISEIAVTTDMKTFTFIDDELTPDVDETETLNVQFLVGAVNEDNTKRIGYIKYNDKAYKVTIDPITFKIEDLKLIYEPTGTEGQTTAEGWTILYDNGTTAEAVCPIAMQSLRLGYSETATDEETQLTEAIESYNNAITTMNNYCKNELTGLPTNSNVRSVGASSETSGNYYSDNLAAWNSTYNGVGKKGDILFEQDLVRMAYWEVLYTGTRYWMASRVVTEYSNDVNFTMYYVHESGYLYNDDLWDVYSSGSAYGHYSSYAVRPIITIQNP